MVKFFRLRIVTGLFLYACCKYLKPNSSKLDRLQTLKQARVLVVDDQPLNIQVISQILGAHYQIFMATSGQQAIEFCLQTPPDLVLMDVVMPDMDGLETCQKMKKDSALADIPVLFVTALSEPEEENACWQAGGVDFLHKPVNPSTLLNRVKAHLTLKLQTDLLRELVYLDGLTGAYNRRYYDDYYLRQLAQARRTKQPLALMMIDIDLFKQYNDHWGHLLGDDCLIAVAQTLKSLLHRPVDLFARYGGEEFVCVLPDTDTQGAIHLAEYLLKAVSQLTIAHPKSEFQVVTISIGVAVWQPQDSADMDLQELADKQLYQAKNAGRNCYSCNQQDKLAEKRGPSALNS